jgi:hypothetical protein
MKTHKRPVAALSLILLLVLLSTFATSSEIRTIQDLSTADPKLAVRFFYGIPTSRHDDVQAALSALRKNPGIPEYYAHTWKAFSNQAHDFSARDQILADLVKLRTEWSFRILGEILFDDREIEIPPGVSELEFNSLLGTDFTSIPNRRSATRALERAWLPEAPPSGSSVETWRNWWKVNETRLPSLLQQPPAKSTAMARSPHSKTGLDSPSLPANPTVAPSVSQQLGEKSKSPGDIAADSKWSAWAFASLVGCVLLGFAGWRWRKGHARSP